MTQDNTHYSEYYNNCQELTPRHLQEILESGIDPELAELNFASIQGEEIFEWVYGEAAERRNDGRLRDSWLRTYERCLQAEGWVNKATGRFKQTGGEPIARNAKGEPRKYLNPKGQKVSCTFLKVTPSVWEKVAERHGVPIPLFTVTAEGEALGFWTWVLKEKIAIVITEGDKKAACLLCRGIVAISVSGITMGWRATEKDAFERTVARQLRPELQAFCDGRKITILFDNRPGDYFKSPEWRAALILARLLGEGTLIAQLPGPEKGVDDFVFAGGDVEKILAAAQPIRKYQQQYLWKLSYEVAWEVNKRYLGSVPFPRSGLSGLLSAKGTGKTYGLKELCHQAEREGRKVLLITHRIVLGRAICETLGLTWIEDKFNSKEERLETDLFGFGLCADSLHPLSMANFNPEDWEGAIVIIDEFEQVIWHILNSSTCRDERVAILDTLKALINVVLDSEGLIILQDADLSDLSFDFILGLKDGEKPKPWIARNSYKPQEPWQVRYYDTKGGKGQKDDPSALLKASVEEVNRGGKIWVQVDSQKADRKWGTTNLEKYYRRHCPGKRILRIDQTTVGNPEHDAFECSGVINSLAANYDIVICSPTLATGVSIDLRSHFTVVVGIFQGACSDNEVRQALARVREPVPRWVWVRRRAVGMLGNGSSLPWAVAAGKEKEVRANLEVLKNYGSDFDLEFDRVPFQTWAKMAARINGAAWDFRDAVAEGLKAEGHHLSFTSDSDKTTSDDIRDICLLSGFEDSVKPSEAENLEPHEYEESKKKRAKTDEERHAEEKYELRQRYGVEVTPELVQLDRDRWYGKIQLYYYLTLGAEYLLMRDDRHYSRLREAGGGTKVCPQDVNLLSARVMVHQKLKTLQFTDPQKEWKKDSPEVQTFVELCLFYRYHIKDLCGISISEARVGKDPIGIVNDFLRQLGLCLRGEQRRYGRERVRVYKFGGLAPAKVIDASLQKIGEPLGLRDEIFTQWQTRDAEALTKWREARANPSSTVVTAGDSGEFVTALTKNKELVDAVTKLEEPSQQPVEGVWGWLKRWGQRYRAILQQRFDEALWLLVDTAEGWQEWASGLADFEEDEEAAAAVGF